MWPDEGRNDDVVVVDLVFVFILGTVVMELKHFAAGGGVDGSFRRVLSIFALRTLAVDDESISHDDIVDDDADASIALLEERFLEILDFLCLRHLLLCRYGEDGPSSPTTSL